MMRKLTTEEFVEKAKTVHGDNYDYSKVEYLNNSTKVCIICPEHGEFWQKPSNHLMGNGCPKCNGKGLSSEEYIIEAHKVHGDKYDYSKVDYKSKKEKICIICPEHGEFWQIAQSHLSSHGCPKCAIEHCGDTQRLSKEDFISKAKSIHCDKYDYSKVEYVNAQTKVCIICPEHGEFLQVPNAHLRGNGCPKCSGKYKTTQEFIELAKKVHNNKYDYSKVNYVNNNTKVCIICPEHGEFWQAPHNHLQGKGCPKCSGKYKTTQEFIELAKKVHNNKYDYSKTIFVNNATKVCIICPEHGEFWQGPYQHLNGNGCPECAFEKTSERLRLTTKEFIRKACEVHGDKYDYSKVEYVGNNTPVCIICPEHGEFWQKPSVHINCKSGCPKCSGNERYSTESWIQKAREVHGDKYDYSKVEYKSAKTKVCIICLEHGEFWQTPSSHLNGNGCPLCVGQGMKQYKFNLLQEFESEYELRAFLENNDVNILYVILRNVEPKFEPIKGDIEKALKNIELKDPIQALEEKYTKDNEEETEETSADKKEEETTTIDITNVDLDDENAVNDVIGNEDAEEEEDTNTEPTIEDVVKNTEKELEVISKIEHMLTPEDREYIMEKFLNDKLRDWMANREASKND